jgi:gluconokinase
VSTAATGKADPVTVVVVTGVSGSGKSTVGAAVADRLGWAFLEGDDFHSPAAIEKMRRGEPLDDADRDPWLDRLHGEVVRRVADGEPAVLAASLLKRRYREHVAAGCDPGDVRFVFLDVDRATLAERLRTRKGHYMAASLLDSQLAALEPPTDDEALVVEGAHPLAVVVADLARRLVVEEDVKARAG